jgi:hypothetical protein
MHPCGSGKKPDGHARPACPRPGATCPGPRQPVPFDLNHRQSRRFLFLTLFRMHRHGGGAWLQDPPAERTLMFPMALSALRPTARQRRESGATRCDNSGTFRTRNRISTMLFVFSSATQNTKGLWHAGGAPPRWRFPGRGERPDQPLARSVSHRIAPARPLAPARRGTDPPGDSKIKIPIPPPAPGGGEGVGVLAGLKFNPVGVVDLSPG